MATLKLSVRMKMNYEIKTGVFTFSFLLSALCLYSQDTPASLLKSARQKESSNDFKGVIDDCSKAISLKADFDSAYCLRGIAFLKT